MYLSHSSRSRAKRLANSRPKGEWSIGDPVPCAKHRHRSLLSGSAPYLIAHDDDSPHNASPVLSIGLARHHYLALIVVHSTHPSPSRTLKRCSEEPNTSQRLPRLLYCASPFPKGKGLLLGVISRLPDLSIKVALVVSFIRFPKLYQLLALLGVM